MLATGVSGLLAFQKALDTISNNISNVNTPGYSAETANLVTNPASPAPNGWLGTGVSVNSVTRSYDAFLATQLNSSTSSYNQLNTLSTLAGNISNMFADTSSGLSATLQSFSGAIQSMANAPAQTATRQAVLTQAQSLVSQFKSYNSSLSQIASQVNGQIQGLAGTITSLGQNIAQLNQQITAASANGSGQAPNQLLDQRDSLINQLSQDIGVNTVTQSDGSVNVFIGNGQPLVLGASSSTLSAGPDQFNSGQLQVSLQTTSGSVDITNSLTGGSLGGLLQFQQQMLVPAQNTLGQAAVTLTNLLNNQNEAGLDLNGAVGQALLAVGGPQVLPSGNNTGSADVSAAVSDLGTLTTSNYDLKYDGSNWSLVDTASGAATSLTAATSGTPPITTLTGAGLTLTVSGTAKAGDRFLVEPTSNAVAGLTLLTSDPSKIAAAGPLITSAAAGNSGNASIQDAVVPDTSASAWTRGDYTLTFSSATGFAVKDASGAAVTATVTDAAGNPVTPPAYSSGATISFNGIEVTLTGTPAAGDSFAIDDNAGGSGDNSNALLMANILNTQVLNGGTASLSDVVNAYVGTVGVQTSQAQNGATAQQSAMTSAQAAQQSVSGVNLDEEAANMVQFEQAYQAAAQVIAASATLFNSLLGAVQSGR
jgi:flagellar hook-associated protein 1 FlgK